MGKRLAQALLYGAFGGVFVPLVGAILLLPALLVLLGISLWPVWSGLVFAMPITIVSVPFVDYSGSTSLAWLAIPGFGALVFAFGGALMRPDGDRKWNDSRLLRRFYREVFVWMLRGVMVCGVWGAVLGVILTWKTGDGLAGAASGAFGGTLYGEVAGLLLGAARGASRTRSVSE